LDSTLRIRPAESKPTENADFALPVEEVTPPKRSECLFLFYFVKFTFLLEASTTAFSSFKVIRNFQFGFILPLLFWQLGETAVMLFLGLGP
jgi:hypothetical protein